MKLPDKFNPLFDRFLLGGLGCGFVVLCVLMGGFFYIWQNPPRPGPTTTPLAVGDLTTITPGSTPTALFQFATPSLLPTGFLTVTPTQVGALPSAQIPSPIAQFD